MGGRNLIVLGVAVVLGLIAVVLVNAYFTGNEERQARLAEEQRLVRIAVATQPIAFGSPLTVDNIRLQSFPAASVPQGAFTSLEAAMQGKRVALRPMVPGEPVLASKVSGSDGRAVLAANLPEGMRAVTIPIDAVKGVAGFVRPGDTVDVLLTRQIPGDGATGDDQMSDVILQRAQVLAIDQVADENSTEAKVGATATLQVDLYNAQKLAVAEKLGVLSLALRNVEAAEPAALTTVTKRDLGGRQIYIPARRQASAPAAAPAMRPMFLPAPNAPAAATAAAPALPMGPSMAVIRGVETTRYPVGTSGGRPMP